MENLAVHFASNALIENHPQQYIEKSLIILPSLQPFRLGLREHKQAFPLKPGDCPFWMDSEYLSVSVF